MHAQVDWGFEVDVFGIFVEPTESERKSYEDQVKKVSDRSLHPDLACWILNLLAREHNKTLDKQLYTVETFKALGNYFETAKLEKKLNILLLLSNMLQSLTRLTVLTENVLEEVLLLRTKVLELSNKLYKTETSNGSNMNTVSKLLQLCVQVVIVIDAAVLALDSLAHKPSLSRMISTPSPFDVVKLPPNVVALTGSDDTNLNDLDSKGLLRWLPEASATNLETANSRRSVRRKPVADGEDDQGDIYSTALSKYGFEQGVHTWNIRVTQYTNGEPIVGLASLPISTSIHVGSSTAQNDVGWGNQQLYVRGRDPIPFGPKVSPGDIVSIEVDVGRGSVSLYRNSALIGLAVGPLDSGALVETSIGSGPFYPAVSLRNIGDTVEFVEFPLKSQSLPKTGTEGGAAEASLVVPEWLKPLKEVVATVRACVQHEIPPHVLHRYFLPTCVRKATTVFERTNCADDECDEEIRIPGASSIVAFFDNVKLRPKDVIRILDESGTVVMEAEGVNSQSAPADLVKAALAVFGSDSSSVSNESSSNVINVGDVVVRGSSWSCDDQDGGVGSTGIVTAIQEWKGKSQSGVQVKWIETQFSGLYRWNHDGHFDLKIFRAEDSVSKPVLSNSSGSFVMRGSSLRIQIVPFVSIDGDESDLTLRQVKVHVVPKFSLASAQSRPEFEPYLQYLKSQYLGSGTLLGDFSLVRHIDSLARSRDMNTSSLLGSKWESFKPSEEDLTRSTALKVIQYPC